MSLSGVLAYALVGTLAFTEAALFIGLVLPGETALLLGGVLASQGRMSLPVLLAVAVVAAIAGDSVGYEVGRRFGPALKAGRLGRMIGDQRWARAEAYVSRRGGSAVFLGRWVGLLRALVPAVAGMVRMPYRRFLVYNLAGGTIWSVTVVLLGYFAGASFKRVEMYLGRASLLLLGVVVAVAVGAAATRYVAGHRDGVLALTGRLTRTAPVRVTVRATGSVIEWISTRSMKIPALSAGLAAALATVTGLTLAFAQLFDNVLDGGGVASLDRPVLAWLAAHRDGEVTVAMQAITTIGGPILLPVLALAGAGLLRWRTRSWEPVVFVAATAAGSATITLAGKYLVGRARPATQFALAGEGGFFLPFGPLTECDGHPGRPGILDSSVDPQLGSPGLGERFHSTHRRADRAQPPVPWSPLAHRCARRLAARRHVADSGPCGAALCESEPSWPHSASRQPGPPRRPGRRCFQINSGSRAMKRALLWPLALGCRARNLWSWG